MIIFKSLHSHTQCEDTLVAAMIHCLKECIETLLPKAPKDIRLKRYVAQVQHVHVFRVSLVISVPSTDHRTKLEFTCISGLVALHCLTSLDSTYPAELPGSSVGRTPI